MGHILVLQPEPGLGGVVARLVGDRHVVTERATVPDLMEATGSEGPFDAIVCALPDARATYEAFLRTARADAHKIIFVVTKESAPAVETMPNPRLVKPFALGDLSAAIDAMVGACTAKASAP